MITMSFVLLNLVALRFAKMLMYQVEFLKWHLFIDANPSELQFWSLDCFFFSFGTGARVFNSV